MTDQERIALLEERVADLSHLSLRFWAVINGQSVNQLELRRLIEKLGAHTRTKVPNGVSL